MGPPGAAGLRGAPALTRYQRVIVTVKPRQRLGTRSGAAFAFDGVSSPLGMESEEPSW